MTSEDHTKDSCSMGSGGAGMVSRSLILVGAGADCWITGEIGWEGGGLRHQAQDHDRR